MDWKSFVVAIAGAIVWPTIVGGLLFVLRKELPDLVKRLSRLEVAGAKAEFVRALERAKGEAEKLETTNVRKALTARPDERYLQLANEHPEAAVMDCFREVERRLVEIRTRLDLPVGLNLGAIVRELVTRNLLDAEAEALFNSLRQARNAATHATANHRVTPGEAVDFTYQTWVLTALLDKVQAGATA
jgi:hypothetical protein